MAKVPEIKKELDKLKVDYPAGATKPELEALLKKKKAEKPEEEDKKEGEDSEEGKGGEDSKEGEEGEGNEGQDGEEGKEGEDGEDFEDASGEVTKMGIYKGSALVSVFTKVNHGKDFVKLAKAKAKDIGGTAKPYVNPDEPEVEKTVVNIVNKSNNLVRQFALSTHGKDYEKLADAFIEKYGEKKGLHIQD